MSQFILLNKNTNKVSYSYCYHRKKNLGSPWNDEDNYVHIEVPEGKFAQAFSWNGTEVVEDTNYSPPDPKAKVLRISRRLPKRLDPLIHDFSILGFNKESPRYDRGRKQSASYKDADDTVVTKTFSDIRDSNGLLTAVSVLFEWFNEDGTLGLSKTEVVKNYNKYEAETEERKRRERQLDYLIAGAKGTPAEPHINTLFGHYHEQQLRYKESGSSDLDDAIDAETDSTILGILDISLPRVDDPNKNITVRQSIKYQTGSMTLEEIEAQNT